MADDTQPLWRKEADYGSVPDGKNTTIEDKDTPTGFPHKGDPLGFQNIATEVKAEQPTTCASRFFPTGFKMELKGLLHLAWPLLVTSLANAMLPTVSLLFCGQLGANQLGAVSLANSIINVTCMAVGMGLATACDTLFSQSYGSSNKKQVGMYLQKALFVLSLACFPCWAIHVNTETILRGIGQNEEIARLAGRYLIYYLPAVWLNFMYQCLSKYIQNQNIVIPSVVIGLLGNGVNALLHWVLVFKVNLGTDGSALAQVGANFTFAGCTLGYIIISGCHKETWGGWTRECLQGWGSFLKLALPGMFMVCLEWWCFEVGTLMSGVLSPIDLGAQSILFYMEGITFQIPIGISIACSIRIGQYLGSGQSDYAKTACNVSLCMCMVGAVFISTLYLTLRNYIPRAFSQDEAVIARAAEVFPLLAAFSFFEGLAGCCGGILRGCGRQTVGAVVIFIGYYLIALPIGLPLLIITPLKVFGLWLGYAAGIFVQGVGFLFLVLTTNWVLEAEEASARASTEVGAVEEPIAEEEEEGENKPPMDHRDQGAAGQSGLNVPPVRRAISRSPPAASSSTIRRDSSPGGGAGGRRYSASTLVTALHGRRFSAYPADSSRGRYQVPAAERRFSTKYTPAIQKDILDKLQAKADEQSNFRKLLCYRLLAFLVCLAILGGGLALRFLFSVPYSPQPMCIPWPQGNTTLPSTTLLPLCSNGTTVGPAVGMAVKLL